MRSANEWFSEYGKSHQNPTNKRIHWFCVPAIFLSVVMILWSIPQPHWMVSIAWLNWATIAMMFAMVFYIMISPRISVGMFLVSIVSILLCPWLEFLVGISAWKMGLSIFIIAWVFQFWGHKIEGKKPSFLLDILFLLIGPAWLMSFIYRRLNIKY